VHRRSKKALEAVCLSALKSEVVSVTNPKQITSSGV